MTVNYWCSGWWMVSAAIKKYLAVWLLSTLHFTRPVVGSVLVYRLGCSGNWQVYRQLLHARTPVHNWAGTRPTVHWRVVNLVLNPCNLRLPMKFGNYLAHFEHARWKSVKTALISLNLSHFLSSKVDVGLLLFFQHLRKKVSQNKNIHNILKLFLKSFIFSRKPK